MAGDGEKCAEFKGNLFSKDTKLKEMNFQILPTARIAFF